MESHEIELTSPDVQSGGSDEEDDLCEQTAGAEAQEFDSIARMGFEFLEIQKRLTDKPQLDPLTGKPQLNPPREMETDLEIEEIDKFIKVINELVELSDKTEYAYRGSADEDYQFKASLFRDKKKESVEYRKWEEYESWFSLSRVARKKEIVEQGKSSEQDYYHHALRLAPEEFTNRSAFDVLCKMQHYSIPTRLLDLTSNPLIALWFACNGSEKENQKAGQVEIVRGHFFPSGMHEIQILCLIGEYLSKDLRDREDNYLHLEGFHDFLLKKNIWCGGEDFVTYLNTILKVPFVGVRPDYTNPRLKLQQGLFLLSGIHTGSEIPDSQLRFPVWAPHPPKDHVYKIKIPATAKRTLSMQLKKIGIDRSRIFPELEQIAIHIRQELVTGD